MLLDIRNPHVDLNVAEHLYALVLWDVAPPNTDIADFFNVVLDKDETVIQAIQRMKQYVRLKKGNSKGQLMSLFVDNQVNIYQE